MTYGIPIGAPFHTVPKSGCRRSVRPTEFTNASDRGCTGYAEISVFHGLSAGNTAQEGSPAATALSPGPDNRDSRQRATCDKNAQSRKHPPLPEFRRPKKLTGYARSVSAELRIFSAFGAPARTAPPRRRAPTRWRARPRGAGHRTQADRPPPARRAEARAE